MVWSPVVRPHCHRHPVSSCRPALMNPATAPVAAACNAPPARAPVRRVVEPRRRQNPRQSDPSAEPLVAKPGKPGDRGGSLRPGMGRAVPKRHIRGVRRRPGRHVQDAPRLHRRQHLRHPPSRPYRGPGSCRSRCWPSCVSVTAPGSIAQAAPAARDSDVALVAITHPVATRPATATRPRSGPSPRPWWC